MSKFGAATWRLLCAGVPGHPCTLLLQPIRDYVVQWTQNQYEQFRSSWPGEDRNTNNR